MKNKNRFWILPLFAIGMYFMLTNSCDKYDDNNDNPPSNTVTDIDGNVYYTDTIGTQIWMVENLKTTKYRDGTDISNVTDNTAWTNLSTGAYCDYDNIPSNSNTYGRLYNWYAVKGALNICPSGWHVPTDDEWTTLTTYLGGESVAGGKLKETGTSHWHSPNTGATNESGFTALPGGNRSMDGGFYYLGYSAYFWHSAEYGTDGAWIRYLDNDNASVYHIHDDKDHGFSVRCIKDN
jgi:uncharacterized protein (TIGR02145 family)